MMTTMLPSLLSAWVVLGMHETNWLVHCLILAQQKAQVHRNFRSKKAFYVFLVTIVSTFMRIGERLTHITFACHNDRRLLRLPAANLSRSRLSLSLLSALSNPRRPRSSRLPSEPLVRPASSSLSGTSPSPRLPPLPLLLPPRPLPPSSNKRTSFPCPKSLVRSPNSARRIAVVPVVMVLLASVARALLVSAVRVHLVSAVSSTRLPVNNKEVTLVVPASKRRLSMPPPLLSATSPPSVNKACAAPLGSELFRSPPLLSVAS